MKKILIVFGCCFCISALDASYGGAEEKDYSNSGYDMIFQTPEEWDAAAAGENADQNAEKASKKDKKKKDKKDKKSKKKDKESIEDEDDDNDVKDKKKK